MTVAAEQAHSSNMPRLRYAMPETRDVIGILEEAGGTRGFEASVATIPEVLESLQSTEIVHLACHGIQHPNELHKSRFCLSTGNLTVSNLMQTNLKGPFLAYLSACETAKGTRSTRTRPSTLPRRCYSQDSRASWRRCGESFCGNGSRLPSRE